MKRRVEEQLISWKDSPRRKPLIIRGARQVGKTWLVENVLAGKFESFVKIDLEKRRDLHVCVRRVGRIRRSDFFQIFLRTCFPISVSLAGHGGLSVWNTSTVKHGGR